MPEVYLGPLQKFKDSLSKDLYGQTTHDAQQSGLCIQCKQPAIPNCYSEAGIREYSISGLCEKCFDEITREPDEPEEEIEEEQKDWS